MTAKQIFEKILKVLQQTDTGSAIHLKLASEIDDVTMCETYEVIISSAFLKEWGVEEITSPGNDSNHLMSISVWMDVKYEECYPSELIFYEHEGHRNKLISYRLQDDLYNPFGIRCEFTNEEWFYILIDNIIKQFFEAVIQKTIYDIVKSL